MNDAKFQYLLRLADTPLVLGHRLSEWSSRAPSLEEDIALSNIALDLIGQARGFYAHAATTEGKGRTEDDLAFLRDAHQFESVPLVAQENGDFARTIARQLFYSAFATPFYEALAPSRDPEIAGIAAKAAKECAYHLRHASEWAIRLGDGTEESHRRMQDGVDALWGYTGQLFEVDTAGSAMIAAGIGVDAGSILPRWLETIDAVLLQATLQRPTMEAMADGAVRDGPSAVRDGPNGPLVRMLAEMQSVHRAHPGVRW